MQCMLCIKRMITLHFNYLCLFHLTPGLRWKCCITWTSHQHHITSHQNHITSHHISITSHHISITSHQHHITSHQHHITSESHLMGSASRLSPLYTVFRTRHKQIFWLLRIINVQRMMSSFMTEGGELVIVLAVQGRSVHSLLQQHWRSIRGHVWCLQWSWAVSQVVKSHSSNALCPLKPHNDSPLLRRPLLDRLTTTEMAGCY